ncbi:outer membrane beta-barrel protein [Thiohalorhabdus denitrificans]|uniref:OmpA-OmpF porin, OOP family n=1 Tax=Thiohalorhabdus denitrificans TaxID=381306 RepID=A0A1G5ESN1_9GAMM|nr:outer membrane beta-barrel protein [Thiohalorhabdus denitrificans]SCY30009.1 OmpA-OmpF porin, OOP family [Thiohalorhabdus denitrificans]
MRTHYRVFGLGAALLLAPGAVAAQGSNPAPGWQGFYLGGGVGDFQYEEEGEVQDVQYSFDESDTAYKLFAGYRFLPFLGVELAYADLGEPGGGIDEDVLGDRLDADADAWFGYVTGYLPVADAFDFFGKVGVAAWEVDTDLDTGPNQADLGVSHDGTDFAWGLGAQVNLPANVSIRGEYERIELGDDGNRDRDASLISASVLFHF